MKSISIVTAAYNECPGIIQLANEWLTFFDQHTDISEGEIIICDDHSDLQQYESLCNAFIGNHRVTILRNEKNEGPGFSFQKAIYQAKYEWTLITDSDGQFPIDNLNQILTALAKQDTDVVFTHRNRKYDNEFNRFGQKISNKLCNAIFNSELKDFSCAFKLVKTTLLQSLKLDARYMNYSLDHTGKLLNASAKAVDIQVNCRAAEARKRNISSEIKRAKNRFLYIAFLFFTQYLRKNRVIF
jgi:glycosyltransferase involved in cell wall biosynthesis